MFEAAGVGGARCVDAAQLDLDDHHLLVTADWEAARHAGEPVHLASTFLLRRDEGRLQVLASVNHRTSRQSWPGCERPRYQQRRVSAARGCGRSPTVFCASVTYPVETGRFDLDYFATRHAPMFAELLGENCVHWEVHRPVAAPEAPPPPFLAAAYFWVRSGEDFGRVLTEHGTVIYADIAEFTEAQPVRGWSEVL